MRHRRWLVLGLPMLWIAAGCATRVSEGRTALRHGNYLEAASRFENVLASNPRRTDALVGLGVSKYKLGAFDEAAETLGRAVARTPNDPTVRLYLALSHLQKGEYGPVEEHLAALAALKPGPRAVAQIDRALRLTRGSEPLSDEIRAFMAASLEDETGLERQLTEAQRALRESEMRRIQYSPPIHVDSRGRCRC